MKKDKDFLTITKDYYEPSTEDRKRTVATRDPRTGFFTGRTNKASKSDNPRYLRMVKPLDYNKDRVVDFQPGQIIGRIPNDSRYAKRGEPPQVRVNLRKRR